MKDKRCPTCDCLMVWYANTYGKGGHFECPRCMRDLENQYKEDPFQYWDYEDPDESY